MSKPKLPKSNIECPTCDKASGMALGPGFSRRRFLQVAGTGLVASYFADVLTKLVNNWPNRRLDELLPWSWTPEAS